MGKGREVWERAKQCKLDLLIALTPFFLVLIAFALGGLLGKW